MINKLLETFGFFRKEPPLAELTVPPVNIYLIDFFAEPKNIPNLRGILVGDMGADWGYFLKFPLDPLKIIDPDPTDAYYKYYVEYGISPKRGLILRDFTEGTSHTNFRIKDLEEISETGIDFLRHGWLRQERLKLRKVAVDINELAKLFSIYPEGRSLQSFLLGMVHDPPTREEVAKFREALVPFNDYLENKGYFPLKQ